MFLHPSDELYGADRMLLEMVRAVEPDMAAEVWLPDDLGHPPAHAALCTWLEAEGIRFRHLGLPVLRRAYRTPRDLAALAGRAARLVRELRAARPDVVYCTTSAAFLAAPAARLAGVPLVLGHLQEIWTRADAVALVLPARFCRRLLSISDAVAAAVPAVLRDRVTVVPNGTPGPARVVPLDGRSGELTYLVASRWNGWKGHRTLLRAWDGAGAPGRLVVLGGPPPSGESVDVPALVAELRRPETVTVAGEVLDPSTFVEAADVVVMPSDQPEPFGLVAIEAFAQGRPVVGSAAGGLADVITHGRDGWVFPPGDVEALAKILVSLTRPDVTAAGRHARQAYETRYTVERFAADWRRVLHSALH